MKEKVCAFLLTLTLLVGNISASVFAAEAIVVPSDTMSSQIVDDVEESDESANEIDEKNLRSTINEIVIGDEISKVTLTSTPIATSSDGKIREFMFGNARAFTRNHIAGMKNGFAYRIKKEDYKENKGAIGYVLDKEISSLYDYAASQVAVWLLLKSEDYTSVNVRSQTYSLIEDLGDYTSNNTFSNRVYNIYSSALRAPSSYYVISSPDTKMPDVFIKELPETYTYTGKILDSEVDYTNTTLSGTKQLSTQLSLKLQDSMTGDGISDTSVQIDGVEYTSDEQGEILKNQIETLQAEVTTEDFPYVKMWVSLLEEEKKDAQSKSYYQSLSDAESAAKKRARELLKEALSEKEKDISYNFEISLEEAPYGYCLANPTSYVVSCNGGESKEETITYKPWEAWLEIQKQDKTSGESGEILQGARFQVYEYHTDSQSYTPYRHTEFEFSTDKKDGTYSIGPLYYHAENEGKFMIVEETSPEGYQLDKTNNRFYLEIVEEGKIKLEETDATTAGTYVATQENPYGFLSLNEAWKMKIEAEKLDEDTGTKLSGVSFDIFEFDKETGTYKILEDGQLTEQSGTYSSEWIYWSEKNQGKFYLVETNASNGYFGSWKQENLEKIEAHPAGWQADDEEGKKVYSFTLTGSRTEEGVVEGHFNQSTHKALLSESGMASAKRTKGKITIKTYDTESESGRSQGDASLDGAVYELYAAEDIFHADGKTGLLYRKGDLVKTGTSNNAVEGIVFSDIEAGKYLLKQKKASKGYMLDETSYKLSFVYDDETQRVILRQESAKDDLNTLKIDDTEESRETIYVGSHVQKHAFSIEKSFKEEKGQELLNKAGAGFSIYLISDLQKVKDGSITPKNGKTWSSADISTFYDYDFSEEETAKVYKRMVERWTDADRKWLSSIKNGNTNEYGVKEMFTDVQGKITSPELPYGMYLLIETTVLDREVMAKPVLVEIKADAGVVYTDETRETVKETFTKEKNIRFGDHDQAIVYPSPDVYDANAIEGRLTEEKESIEKQQTQTYIRLLSIDDYFLPLEDEFLMPEKFIKGSILKEGASYRLKAVDLTKKEKEVLLANGWNLDENNYISCLEKGVELGTISHPFTPTLQKKEGKITDCYLILPLKLPTGSYELVEVSAPAAYVSQGREQSIKDISTEQVNAYQIIDTPKKALQFVIDNEKVYPNGQMGEQKYFYTDTSDHLVVTIFQEKQAQQGIVELVKMGESFQELENSEFVYRETPVKGAVYEIYAEKDIYSQAIDSSKLDQYGIDVSDYLLWKKDELIGSMTTDKNGYAYFADLPVGKYYICEKVAGDGFVKSEEIKHFEITADGTGSSFIMKEQTSSSQRQRVQFAVKNQDEVSKQALCGTIYALYNKNSIESSLGTEHLILADTLLEKATTGIDGIANFTGDYPLGEYYIKEVKASQGYTSSKEVIEIDASYKNAEIEIQKYTDFVLESGKSKHSFIASDFNSGEVLENAYLEVWEILTDSKGNLLKNQDGSFQTVEVAEATFVSGKTEYVLNGLEVGKAYVFRETLAPENYVAYYASSKEIKQENQEDNAWTEEVMFIVKDTAELQRHNLKHQRTTGSISISKAGEFFVGTSEDLSVLAKMKSLFQMVFHYVQGNLQDAAFEVYVKEDIFTPDKSGNYASWTNQKGETVLLKKDTKVDTILTDSFGIANIEGLPLGSYYLRESKQEDGIYLVNKEDEIITFRYVDQETPVVFWDGKLQEPTRQKIKIQVKSTNEATGAVFGLYAGEDLHGYVQLSEHIVGGYPTLHVKKDTLLEKAQIDETGNLVFEADIPYGLYYVKQLTAVPGGLLSNEKWEIDASKPNEDGDFSFDFEISVSTQESKVSVRKEDLHTQEPIVGAVMEIIEEESEEVVDSWTSDDLSHSIGGIRLSKEYEHSYLLRESHPAAGYVSARDIRFVVQGEEDKRNIWIFDDEWKSLEDSVIVVKNDITKTEIQKTKKNGKTPLEGVALELLDQEGQQIATWISEKNPKYLERLPVGTYTIQKVSKKKAASSPDKIEIEILDQAELQSFAVHLGGGSSSGGSGGSSSNRGEDTNATGAAVFANSIQTVNSPATGDSNEPLVWMFLLSLSLGSLIQTYKFSKKRNRK